MNMRNTKVARTSETSKIDWAEEIRRRRIHAEFLLQEYFRSPNRLSADDAETALLAVRSAKNLARFRG